MEEQPNKPSFFLIIFVLFLIVSIIIITFIYIKKGLDSSGLSSLFNKKNNEDVITTYNNTTYHTLELKTNTESTVSYNLYENGTFLLNGNVEPNIKLLYSQAIHNKTYLFEAKQEGEYYYNKKSCVVVGNTTCYLEMKKVGNYSLSFSNSVLHINQQEGGVLQSPLLCIAWTFDIYIVKIENYEKTQIPKRLRPLVDVCYVLDKDIETSLDYDIGVTRVNPKVSKITFYLIDKDIGDDNIISYEQDTGFPDIVLEQEI